jgi:hypothetical protein
MIIITNNHLEVLVQLANVEIARPDVVTWVRTRDLTVVYEFKFNGFTTSFKTKKNYYE